MKKILLNWLLNDFIKRNPIPNQFKGQVIIGNSDENSRESRERCERHKKCSQNTWAWFRKLLKEANIENDI